MTAGGGNPVVPGFTSAYKEHGVGHCCAESKKAWQALSESQKDAVVSRLLM